MELKKKPKIVILTVSAGGGHVAAAKALERGFQERYGSTYNVQVYDALTEKSLKLLLPLDKIAVPAYERGVKLWNSYPWKLFFEFSNATSGLIDRFATTVFHDKGIQFLLKEKPDVIITTFPIIAFAINRLVREGWYHKIPIISIITDSGDVHKLWLSGKSDAMLVSTADTIEHAVDHGVPRSRLLNLGFPIDRRFAHLPEKAQARERLGLLPDKATFVFTAGGLGMGSKLYQLAKELSRRHVDAQYVFISGKNKQLARDLQALPFVNHFVVHEYVSDMPLFMAAADVVIGKAGWITLYEAMASRRPVFVIDLALGQEEPNAEFVVRHGVGRLITNTKAAAAAIEEVVAYPDVLRRYGRNLNSLGIDADASLRIADFVVKKFVEPLTRADKS